jgi:hypothetical protein
MMVALRMTVVWDANGTYVLGNGFAFGTDSEPIPGLPALSGDVFVAVADVDATEGDAAVVGAGVFEHATPTAQSRNRLVRIQ